MAIAAIAAEQTARRILRISDLGVWSNRLAPRSVHCDEDLGFSEECPGKLPSEPSPKFKFLRAKERLDRAVPWRD